MLTHYFHWNGIWCSFLCLTLRLLLVFILLIKCNTFLLSPQLPPHLQTEWEKKWEEKEQSQWHSCKLKHWSILLSIIYHLRMSQFPTNPHIPPPFSLPFIYFMMWEFSILNGIVVYSVRSTKRVYYTSQSKRKLEGLLDWKYVWELYKINMTYTRHTYW